MTRQETTSATAELVVPSMVCEGCAETIRTALVALSGVREVKVSLWRKCVRVRYEPGRLQEADIRQAIAASGFAIQDGKPDQ